MANVFGILTALVLALSAFIAYKNKGKYEETVAEAAKQADSLSKEQALLAVQKKVLAALPEEIKGVQTEIEKLTGAEASLKRSNSGLKEATDKEEAKVAENKEKLTTVRSKIEASGNLDDLASQLRTTATTLEELGQKVSSSEAQFANLESQVNSSETKLDTVKAKFESFSNNESSVGLKTRIRAIYPNWGFVTLASGNNAGVVAKSKLNVLRDDEVIAKLLVTAVESSTSSASIDPTSLGSDVTLRVGDRVEPEVKTVATKPIAPTETPAVPTTADPAGGTPIVDPAGTVPAVDAPVETTTPAPAAEADPFSN